MSKTANRRQLILGSSSKPRQILLQRLQIPFTIVIPNIDETPLTNEPPEQLVVRLAQQKATTVAQQYPEAIIIAADQVGTINSQILGKPLNEKNAIQQLHMVSGQTVKFVIGLCVLDASSHCQQLVLEEFEVDFRTLSLTQIESYIKKEKPLQSAGSCNAEGLGIALIREFRGKDYTALIGLPLIRLVAMLEKAGVDVLT